VNVSCYVGAGVGLVAGPGERMESPKDEKRSGLLGNPLSRRSTLRLGAVAAGTLIAGGWSSLFVATLASAATVAYRFPFPIEWYDELDPFGNTLPPWRSPTSPHRGADFNGGTAGVRGTPIRSAGAGVVAFSGWYDGLGWMVSLRHADGFFSGYCHMNERPSVRVGDPVVLGGIVGRVGGTATSTFSYAPHLHLTMATDVFGTQGGASRFDPIAFISARTQTSLTQNEETDTMFMIFAYDPGVNPSQRWALVGPGFWFTTASISLSNSLTSRFGGVPPANVTWADWDRAFNAAVASGFVPALGQTARTV
jgi:hypothetical protein